MDLSALLACVRDYLNNSTHETLTDCLIAIEDLRAYMIMDWCDIETQRREQHENQRRELNNTERFARLRLIR